jgi:hypothetical protein
MTLSETRALAGQLGGLTTAHRFPGMAREWGQLGAPARPTLAEIREKEEATTTVRGTRGLLRAMRKGAC